MAAAIFFLQQGASTGDWAVSPVPVEGTRLGRKSALSLWDVGQNKSSRRSISYSRTASALQTDEPGAALFLFHTIPHFRFWDRF